MGGRASSPTLVGRESELDRLAAALTAAEAGHPSVALLAGEAGIGKTRLVHALEAMARERGFLVLRGDCFESAGADLAYAPVVSAFRTVGTLTSERIKEDRSGWWSLP